MVDGVKTADRKNSARLEGEFATAFSNQFLHLIILPTEQCNFRCVYCYEDFSVGRMKSAVVAGIKRLIEQRAPTLRQLQIAWFGGEPLIALSIIEDISAFSRDLAVRTPDLNYSAEMTTNAYRLDINTAARLYELGVKHYQITLDGPEHFHDQTRVRINGSGSFARIWDNLNNIKRSELPLEVVLRVHVMEPTLAVMPAFLEDLRRTFLNDPRFKILLKAVGKWGGPHDKDLPVLESSRAAEVLSTLKSKALSDLRREAFYEPGEVCYASRPNSMVIRATGDIGKCTVALADPANKIGRLLPDGTIEVRDEALTPWLRGWSTQDNAALGCPLVGLPRARQPVLLQIGASPGRV